MPYTLPRLVTKDSSKHAFACGHGLMVVHRWAASGVMIVLTGVRQAFLVVHKPTKAPLQASLHCHAFNILPTDNSPPAIHPVSPFTPLDSSPGARGAMVKD